MLWFQKSKSYHMIIDDAASTFYFVFIKKKIAELQKRKKEKLQNLIRLTFFVTDWYEAPLFPLPGDDEPFSGYFSITLS